jgi:hypothetical protein
LASLAANLVNKGFNDAGEAVAKAIEIWANVLERGTERAIEVERLSCAWDKPKAQQRWHQWHLRHLGLEEAERNYQAKVTELRAYAASTFKGLIWPASFDDVMRRIMNGALDDGKEAKRYEDYRKVWLNLAQPENEARIRRQQPSKPGVDEVLAQAEERRRELLARGEIQKAQTWTFYGVPEHEKQKRLKTATSELVEEWTQRTDAMVKDGANAISNRAKALRSEQWDETDAIHALELWRNHRSNEQRREAGKTRWKNKRLKEQGSKVED